MANNAPIFKTGCVRLTTGDTGVKVIAVMSPTADIMWKCSMVSAFPYPHSTIDGQSGTPIIMRVNGSDVFEAYLARNYREAVTLVIPWSNGIRDNGLTFLNGEQVKWLTSANTANLFVSATWCGSVAGF